MSYKKTYLAQNHFLNYNEIYLEVPDCSICAILNKLFETLQIAIMHSPWTLEFHIFLVSPVETDVKELFFNSTAQLLWRRYFYIYLYGKT